MVKKIPVSNLNVAFLQFVQSKSKKDVNNLGENCPIYLKFGVLRVLDEDS